MRVLKAELREVEGLKLCGKRINKYCDTNSDSIITVDEFTQCLRQGNYIIIIQCLLQCI